LPIYRAFLAYEKGDFETANKELEILDDYSKTPELQFYNAISLLELEEFDKAQRILNQIDTKDPELAQDISWYSALILLRINKLNEAKKILQKTLLSPSRKHLLDEL
jgi:tetratricopeptide (TPR) repeat protein